jgi:hypothetical protein
MKSFGICLLNLVMLAGLLTSCGKNNESGRSNNYGLPYYANQYGTINSNYSYGGLSVNQVIQYNPCIVSGTQNQARVQVQIPVQLQTIMPTGDIYVGVTSSGDVGLLVGQGSASALFVGYICQRGVMYNQTTQPQITDLAFGSYSQCSFKPITRATLILPGAFVPLYFRWLDGGASIGQKFPFCR